jgi:hypothetical protein
MRKSRFSAEQISTALRQVESGASVAELTRKLRVSEKTYYLGKKQNAHLLTNELRKLRAHGRATENKTCHEGGNPRTAGATGDAQGAARTDRRVGL